MGINAVQNRGKEVIAILEANGHNNIANELTKHIVELQTPEKISFALNSIIGLCHAKNMGDLNIKQNEGYEWLRMLSKLEKKTRQTLKELLNKI